jgi:UDP-N-acetyl-D-galactosamine dehydrogenase
MGIDTQEVLKAAGTKWNFLPFKPGLVGGHCIGVDPYYLTHKAESIGYRPEIILAGRRINDNMGAHVAHSVIKLMAQNKQPIHDGNILVLGITFKENCPDIRNSKVVDVIHELESYGATVDIFDPQADTEEVKDEYGLSLADKPNKKYNAIVLAVSHDEFNLLDLHSLLLKGGVIYDVKGVLDRSKTTASL